MDLATNLPKVLLSVIESVQTENHLKSWRLYAENGQTNIVLKFVPIEEPFITCQGPLNSNKHVHAGYGKHKSPAKISRGYDRAQEFHHSFSENVPKCDTEDSAYSTFDSRIKDVTLDTKEKASQYNSCDLTEISSQSESTCTESHLSKTGKSTVSAQHSQQPSSLISSSEVTETNSESCSSDNSLSCDFDKIISIPNLPECKESPLFTKTLSERESDQYFNARDRFHSGFKKKDLESMTYFATLYKIFDPCPHLKATNIYGVT